MEIEPKIREFYDSLPDNHILAVFFKEHELILEIMEKMKNTNSQLQKKTQNNDAKGIMSALIECSNKLLDTESHLRREEEVLFPEMIVRKIVGPPRVMMMEHEMLRKNKRIFYETVKNYSSINWEEFKKQVNELYLKLYYKLWDHIQRENEDIFLLAHKAGIDDELWIKLSDDCDQIGYDLFTPTLEEN